MRARGVTATMRLFAGAIAMAGLGYGGAHGPRIFAYSIALFIPFVLLAGRLGPIVLIHAMGLRKPAGSSE